VNDDWVLPPLDRQPIKHGFGSGNRIGVMWPHRAAPSFDVLDVEAHERLARALERAGVDFVLVTDGYREGGDAGLRSMLWAVPIILATTTIGVYTSMRTTFLHPTQIARFGAHLDWLSQGRWGWSVVTGSGDADARLYGLDRCPASDDRYELAAESVDAVGAIWASGDEGVAFESAHYRLHGRVKRPQVIQRPRPPLLGSGSSRGGMALAARKLDAGSPRCSMNRSSPRRARRSEQNARRISHH
jgi:dimethylsulfone monooxygenase